MKPDHAIAALLTGAGLALAAPHAALAQKAAATTMTMETHPGQALITHETTVTAKIVGIDHAKRKLQVKFADGGVRELEVGTEVKNFAKLAIGDQIHAKYVEALSLELRKAGSHTIKGEAQEATYRNMVGKKPSATTGRVVSGVATVTGVDHKTHTIHLRNPDGHLVDLQVNDPAQLNGVAVGDHVEAIYAEALALQVTEAK